MDDRIRNLLKEGLVAAAATMLTQPYRIRGMVTHGAARGALHARLAARQPVRDAGAARPRGGGDPRLRRPAARPDQQGTRAGHSHRQAAK